MKPYLILVSLSLITLISGCSQVNVNEQLSEAQRALSENKYKESEILLKNVLQEAFDNGEANNLLAVSYFRQGQMDNAEKQFNRAFRQNSLSDETRIFWLQTLLLQQDFEGLEDVINKISVPNMDEVVGFYSLYTTNDTEQPSSMQPDKNPSSSLSVYTRAQSCVQLRLEGKYREALTCLESFQNEQAFNLEYLLESANNYIALGNIEKYGAAVTAVSALFPNFDRYQLLKADALVKLEDFDAAGTLVAKLLAGYPKQPYLNYLQAVIESKNDNVEAAKSFAELAINYGFDNRNSRTIAAVSSYRLGNFEQAYKHFMAFAKDIESSDRLQRLYALTLIRLGYADEAAVSFNAIDSLDTSDYALFQNAANYLDAIGNRGLARSMLERFDNVITNGDESYAALNIRRIKLNDMRALQNLERLNQEGNAEKDVVLALADYYLSAGDMQAAMRTAQELRTVFSDEYTALLIEGRAFDLSESYDQALTVFETVYAMQQDSASALAFFVDHAVRANKLSEAEAYAKRLYELIPNSPATLNKYLNILKRQEKHSEVADTVKTAYEQNLGSSVYATLYASILVTEAAYERALALLNDIEQSPQLPPLFWLTKAKAELAIGNLKDAESTVNAWLSFNQTFKPAYLFAANLYEMTGNIKKSINVLKTAEHFLPADNQVLIMSAFYLVQTGELDSAGRQLDKVSRDIHISAGYKGVKGQLLLAEGDFTGASELLTDYHNEANNYQSLSALTEALTGASRIDDAIDAVSAFVEVNPTEARGVELLAELYINTNHQQAVSFYQKLLVLEPENHVAMNNMAWLLHVNGKNTEAISYSEQALQFQPVNPEYLDTYGMILLRLERVDDAINALLQSIRAKPDSILIRMHLAEAFKVGGLDDESESLLRGITTTIPQVEAEIMRIRSL